MYARNVAGRELTFGVSGLLYKANVLMYDHQSESLWSQMKRQAVTGPMTGTELKVLPSTLTSWRKWKKRFPETEVLSPDTGHVRDYSRDPYEDYYRSRKGFFSFFRPGPGEEEKELVAGVELDGVARAYPLEALRKEGVLADRLGGREITIELDRETDLLTVRDGEGNEIPHITAYWFVWKGFNPESGLYRPKE